MLKTLDETHLDVDTSSPRKKRSIVASALKAIVQLVLMIGIIAGSVMAMNWLIATKPEKPGRPPFQTVYPVNTIAAQIQNIVPRVLVYGQVASERTVDLRSHVAGEIVWVNSALQTGAQVKEGDELVRIDRFNYEGALTEAKANLAQTEAAVSEINARLVSEKEQLKALREQLTLAETDLSRAERLSSSGSVTAKQVEDRRLVVSTRRQSVMQRQSNIEIEKTRLSQQEATLSRLAWRVRQAEKNLEDTALLAPFSGVVRSSVAQVGRSAGANDVLVSMYSLEKLAAKFTLTDAQFGRLVTDNDPLIGRNVEAIWSVGETDYTLSGNVSRIGADIDSARGGVEVFADLDLKGLPSQIRPGAFLEIRLSDKTYNQAILVPEDAIYELNSVYVVLDGRLSKRVVNVHAYENGNAIISGEISDGDRILATRLSVASDGLRVRQSDIAGSDGASNDQAN